MLILFYVKGMFFEYCLCFDFFNWFDIEILLLWVFISSKLYLLSICEWLLSGKKKENVDIYYYNFLRWKVEIILINSVFLESMIFIF